MAQASGHESFFGLAEEATYGTIVARDVFGEFTEDSMKAVVERTQSGAFRKANQRIRVPAKEGAEGGLTTEMSFVDAAQLRLFKHLFGDITTVADTPVVGVTQHTLKLAEQVLDGISSVEGLTLEMGRDAASSFLYQGFIINEGTLTLEPDGIMTLGVTGAAQKETLVTPSSPTFAADNLVEHTQAALTFGAVTKEVTTFELTIANGLAMDRRILGSRNIKQPVREAKREVNGTFTMFFESLTEYNDFVAQTARVLELVLTGAIITGATPYTITLTFDDAEFEGETPAVDSAGFLVINLPFRAYETATKKPVEAVILTDTTSL